MHLLSTSYIWSNMFLKWLHKNKCIFLKYVHNLHFIILLFFFGEKLLKFWTQKCVILETFFLKYINQSYIATIMNLLCFIQHFCERNTLNHAVPDTCAQWGNSLGWMTLLQIQIKLHFLLIYIFIYLLSVHPLHWCLKQCKN